MKCGIQWQKIYEDVEIEEDLASLCDLQAHARWKLEQRRSDSGAEDAERAVARGGARRHASGAFGAPIVRSVWCVPSGLIASNPFT